jgi:AcrR family transcriptional regulator
MARPTLSDVEVDQVRDRICVAAERLFSDQGYANVGLRAIGAEIGLTGAALYRYFPQGREEIVAAVRSRAFRKLADLSQEAVAACSTPLERLRAVAEAYVDFARRDEASYQILFSGMQTGEFPELRKEARRARDILFRTAQEAAHSDESSAQGRIWAHVAWAAIHGAVLLETADMLRMGVDITQLVDGVAHALSHLNGSLKESSPTGGRSRPGRTATRR